MNCLYAWMITDLSGNLIPESCRRTRDSCIYYLRWDIYYLPGEKWEKLYRLGYRCVKVGIFERKKVNHRVEG